MVASHLPSQVQDLALKGQKSQALQKKMTKQRVKRRCCYGEHEKCAFIQKVFHHYDPTDAHIGYVWLTKSSGRFSSSSTRRYDKIRVAAECLGMNHEVDFNTEKTCRYITITPKWPSISMIRGQSHEKKG